MLAESRQAPGVSLLAVVVVALSACGGTGLLLGGAAAFWLKLRPLRLPRTTATDVGAPAMPTGGFTYSTRVVPPLTEAQRTRGFNECNPPDPGNLGPYGSYRKIDMGRLLVPQQGGHTDDLGFDVVVHFHGFDPARKFVVPTAHGIAFAGIERGMGSGPYASTFAVPGRFEHLRDSIERALKEYTGDERAHVRHLGLSAWSAGFGAINEILKRHGDAIDAVVILDGMHGSWKPGLSPRRRRGPRPRSLDDVSLMNVTPTVRFAERAATGRDGKIFVLTVSEVDPVAYPPTALTAQSMLQELGLDLVADAPPTEPFGRLGTVNEQGFTLWAFRGRNEAAHCIHLQYLAPIVTGVLEATWRTPPMRRDVEPTPLPPKAVPQRRRRRR